MRLAITGHRPDKLGGYRTPNPVYTAVRRHMDIALMRLCPTEVIVGMAIGVDQWAAEICIQNDLPFVAAVPFPGFPNQWPPQAQNHYRWLLMKARAVHYVSMSNIYNPAMLHARNEWMVDNADGLLAVQRTDTAGERSGTASTIAYARRKNKPVYLIALDTDLTVRAQQEEEQILRRRQAARTAIIETPPDPPPRALSMNEARALIVESARGGNHMRALEAMLAQTASEAAAQEAAVLQEAELLRALRERAAVERAQLATPGQEAARRRARSAMLQEEARQHEARRALRRRLRELEGEPEKEEEAPTANENGTYNRVIDID